MSTTRRGFIRSLASASILLPGMLQQLLAESSAPTAQNPLAPRAPMFPAKAKRVIFLFMSGGVSHVDAFDWKPKLLADHGKRYKDDYLHAPQWNFHRYAKCDTMVSELFPHVGAMMDDICMINSVRCDIPNHSQAVMQLHGGSAAQPRPSIGSWVSYGLGTFNQNLPSYMVLAPEIPYGGSEAWDSGSSRLTYTWSAACKPRSRADTAASVAC